MSFLKKLFGKKDEPIEGADEHLVRVHIPLSSDFGSLEEFDDWSSLEDTLDEAAQAAGTGYLDGNEVGQGEYTIWLYGKDGGQLAETVRGVLAQVRLPAGSYLHVRHGGLEDKRAREERIAFAGASE